MTKHHVKSWAHFFDAIRAGNKLHDLRKLDRDYKVGDILVLQRYDNINGEYTGEELEAEITYITSAKVPCAFSSSALAKDYGIFSLRTYVKKADTDNFIPADRRPVLVKKGLESFPPFARGGPVKLDGNYLVGGATIEEIIPTSDDNEFGHDWEAVGNYRG
jgi:hypothetical protein